MPVNHKVYGDTRYDQNLHLRKPFTYKHTRNILVMDTYLPLKPLAKIGDGKFFGSGRKIETAEEAIKR